MNNFLTHLVVRDLNRGFISDELLKNLDVITYNYPNVGQEKKCDIRGDFLLYMRNNYERICSRYVPSEGPFDVYFRVLLKYYLKNFMRDNNMNYWRSRYVENLCRENEEDLNDHQDFRMMIVTLLREIKRSGRNKNLQMFLTIWVFKMIYFIDDTLLSELEEAAGIPLRIYHEAFVEIREKLNKVKERQENFLEKINKATVNIRCLEGLILQSDGMVKKKAEKKLIANLRVLKSFRKKLTSTSLTTSTGIISDILGMKKSTIDSRYSRGQEYVRSLYRNRLYSYNLPYEDNSGIQQLPQSGRIQKALSPLEDRLSAGSRNVIYMRRNGDELLRECAAESTGTPQYDWIPRSRR